MDFLKPLHLNMPQGVSLVPPIWKYVKRNLAANAECEVVRGEFLLEDFDKCCTKTVCVVVFQEFESFCNTRVTTDGADVNHSITILHESASAGQMKQTIH